jgi:hypothetical protein
MKAVLVALVLGVCALAYGIGVAWADDGTAAAAPSRSAPATQPVQEDQPEQPRSRDDCPEKDGGGGSAPEGPGSSGDSDTDVRF